MNVIRKESFSRMEFVCFNCKKTWTVIIQSLNKSLQFIFLHFIFHQFCSFWTSQWAVSRQRSQIISLTQYTKVCFHRGSVKTSWRELKSPSPSRRSGLLSDLHAFIFPLWKAWVKEVGELLEQIIALAFLYRQVWALLLLNEAERTFWHCNTFELCLFWFFVWGNISFITLLMPSKRESSAGAASTLLSKCQTLIRVKRNRIKVGEPHGFNM